MATPSKKSAPQKSKAPLIDCTIEEWKPMKRGETMQGILNIGIPVVGVKFIGCIYHVRSTDHKRWIGLPSKSYTSKKDNSTRWQATVEALDDDAHWHLQHSMLHALDEYLGGTKDAGDDGMPDEPAGEEEPLY